jgi:hypothetical protein
MKFHNFKTYNFFLLFVHPLLFKKFKFQNFGNSNVVLLDNMISNEKVVNYKIS